MAALLWRHGAELATDGTRPSGPARGGWAASAFPTANRFCVFEWARGHFGPGEMRNHAVGRADVREGTMYARGAGKGAGGARGVGAGMSHESFCVQHDDPPTHMLSPHAESPHGNADKDE
jgi:hypothetical protein